MSDESTILIRRLNRNWSLFDPISVSFLVVIDGQPIGELRNGETRKTVLPAGLHSISLESPVHDSNEIDISISPEETTCLEVEDVSKTNFLYLTLLYLIAFASVPCLYGFKAFPGSLLFVSFPLVFLSHYIFCRYKLAPRIFDWRAEIRQQEDSSKSRLNKQK